MAKIRHQSPRGLHQQLELRVFSDMKGAAIAAERQDTRSGTQDCRTRPAAATSEEEQSIYLAITANYFDR